MDGVGSVQRANKGNGSGMRPTRCDEGITLLSRIDAFILIVLPLKHVLSVVDCAWDVLRRLQWIACAPVVGVHTTTESGIRKGESDISVLK
jgi:hypothetical protein